MLWSSCPPRRSTSATTTSSNLLQLLAPGDFGDKAVLEDRLRPNAVLNRVRGVPTPGPRTSSQPNAQAMARRPRPDDLRPGRHRPTEIQGTLPATGRPPAFLRRGVAEARRLFFISQLHALNAVPADSHAQDRDPGSEGGPRGNPGGRDMDPDRACLLRSIRGVAGHARASKLGLPVGFVTQMPLACSPSSCLPAARDRRRSWQLTDGTQFDTDLDGGDEDPDEDPDMPPVELVGLAKHLGNIDTKYDQFLPHLLRIVEQGRRVLVFTFLAATLRLS